MMRKLIMLELNEVNFDYVRGYADRGHLPNLGKLIADHGVKETISEREYDDLEPWIQWVTAHTGRSFSEHGVFRLGDILDRPEIEQIWETLEQHGHSVGAISPMNARNACHDAAFFVPDPWTNSTVTGGMLVKKLYKAISQMVNDNAQGHAERSSLLWLLAGLARYAAPSNYSRYLRMAAAIRKPWSRALVLDQLLADLFVSESRRKKPEFATLFLNAAAHIQHHYLFNSSIYDGPNVNPSWYIAHDQDPLLDVYKLYDDIVGSIRKSFPTYRLIVATGLHQDPYPSTLIYWRLRDHAAFLDEMKIPYQRVEARMSRDFVVYCRDVHQAAEAKRLLESAVADDGRPLFEVDDRGDSLFVILTYGVEIPPDMGYSVHNQRYTNLIDKTAFVAIKNGEHNGIGYLIDTDDAADLRPAIPLGELHNCILRHFGVAERDGLPTSCVPSAGHMIGA